MVNTELNGHKLDRNRVGGTSGVREDEERKTAGVPVKWEKKQGGQYRVKVN